jgi:ABC-type oligopeptide transport system substrate-binding subunit
MRRNRYLPLALLAVLASAALLAGCGGKNYSYRLSGLTPTLRPAKLMKICV